jgi:hypothetical protein
MNVPTIEMTPESAQAKLNAYRTQLRRRADAEYEAAAAGYEALAEGRALLNLTDAMNFAGLGDDGRPRLAIARADRKQVHCRVGRREITFNALKNRWSTRSYEGSLVIDVPYNNVGFDRFSKEGFGLVPMVPADVRPKGQLREFFVLWEVEAWSDTSMLAEPDRDPYLLKHIGGDIYAVIAEWDLTELERAIMSGRREG